MLGNLKSALEKFSSEVEHEVVGVTGGCGCLGAMIVASLLSAGVAEVRIFDRDDTSLVLKDLLADQQAAFLSKMGHPADGKKRWNKKVKHYVGDIRSPSELRQFVRGCSTIFHVAAAIDVYRDIEPSVVWDVNVGATVTLMNICEESGVERFVYTSTSEVVVSNRDYESLDETQPYPTSGHYCYGWYAESKATAEAAVLAHIRDKRSQMKFARQTRQSTSGDGGDSTGPGTPIADRTPLASLIFRPTAMYGEGDRFHIGDPCYCRRTGLLPFLLGAPRDTVGFSLDTASRRSRLPKMSWSYTGNVAYAHILGMVALKREQNAKNSSTLPYCGTSVANDLFFVTDDTPHSPFFLFAGAFAREVGLRWPRIFLPFWFVYILACILECVHFVLRPVYGRFTMPLSRSNINALSYHQKVNGDKIRKLLDYTPPVSPEEAFAATAAFFRRYPYYNSFDLKKGVKLEFTEEDYPFSRPRSKKLKPL